MSASRRDRPDRCVPRAQRGWRSAGAIGWARLVLLGFLLSLGVAGASPIVHPQALELVCSGIGAGKVIVHGSDGDHEIGASHLDCPMCLQGGAPPPIALALKVSMAPPASQADALPDALPAAAMALPPPARAPPANA